MQFKTPFSRRGPLWDTGATDRFWQAASVFGNEDVRRVTILSGRCYRKRNHLLSFLSLLFSSAWSTLSLLIRLRREIAFINKKSSGNFKSILISSNVSKKKLFAPEKLLGSSFDTSATTRHSTPRRSVSLSGVKRFLRNVRDSIPYGWNRVVLAVQQCKQPTGSRFEAERDPCAGSKLQGRECDLFKGFKVSGTIDVARGRWENRRRTATVERGERGG